MLFGKYKPKTRSIFLKHCTNMYNKTQFDYFYVKKKNRRKNHYYFIFIMIGVVYELHEAIHDNLNIFFHLNCYNPYQITIICCDCS